MDETLGATTHEGGIKAMPGRIKGLGAALMRDALARAALAPVKLFRATWAYRQTIRGAVPDRLRCVIKDLRPRDLECADRILRGRWQIGARTFAAPLAQIFDAEIPRGETTVLEYLHGFSWLHHLEAAGAGASGEARAAISVWMKNFRAIKGTPHAPHVTARRLLAFFSGHRFLLRDADILWRSPFQIMLAEQSRYLARAANEAEPGLPALTSCVAVAASGLVFGEEARTRRGLELLSRELARQILPDGGHVSRSPGALAEALTLLMPLASALREQGRAVPDALQNAVDRMAPMLRFFLHPDGRFAAFNGAGEGDERLAANLLERDDARGRPFGHAPYSRFQRLTAGRLSIIADMGGAPPFPYASRAHAGALSLDVASGTHRIFGNCGSAGSRGAHWVRAMRETAAHATLSIDGLSSLAFPDQGIISSAAARRFGVQAAGDGEVSSRREENAAGYFVEAHSALYEKALGLTHERRLFLSPAGDDLRGEDRIIAAEAAREPRKGRTARHSFAVRFHLYPDVRATLSQSGDSVLLVLANGEAWRFRASGAQLGLEPSVHLASGLVRKTLQIVLSGPVNLTAEPDENAGPDEGSAPQNPQTIIKWALKLEAAK
ncbi:MAG TPA: heparinase II/III family protein [Micropepsaceae bacterium]|nr:heparinase II/III family protein [Micropepsaceae bacterium]